MASRPTTREALEAVKVRLQWIDSGNMHPGSDGEALVYDPQYWADFALAALRDRAPLEDDAELVEKLVRIGIGPMTATFVLDAIDTKLLGSRTEKGEPTDGK